jgi:catechol 2,3-dioxygenase-like lactoylglutathione lyase family enzyme
MKIEHIAIIVKDPVAVAQWYTQNLGLGVVRAGGAPTFTTFLADEGNHVMIEIYTNPAVAAPDYRSMDPLILHLAFASHDVQADHARLLAAGATPAGDISTTPAGDQLAMLRDPWGFAIQLARRTSPMI